MTHFGIREKQHLALSASKKINTDWDTSKFECRTHTKGTINPKGCAKGFSPFEICVSYFVRTDKLWSIP